MRLWDYRLIKVLPNKQLVSQWRECIAIKRQWEKGTLKHPLVSYVMNYDRMCFLNYVCLVLEEFERRNIKYNNKYLFEIRDFYLEDCNVAMLDFTYCKNNIIYPEHNNRYLKQCYYNLQEKYDRGMITQEEWEDIEDLYYDLGGE